ncbi:MAG TPA: aminotransferase class I/II-fold pyridoxal phosphate-dependent enzyme [Fervidobacterium sp.]|nr:aminotransferase class I/II-fold pyridoxal phosphate-dependent enzyme [Fervidobacterium sp.]
MNANEKVFHGGIRREDYLDFSISISPIRPPFFDDLFSESAIKYVQKYSYVEWLEEEFRKVFGEDTNILAGATEAFQICGFVLMKDAEVVVPLPNYGEYQRVAKFASHNVHFVNILDLEAKTLDYYKLVEYIARLRKNTNRKIVTIFGNPNNPTGIYTDVFPYVQMLEKLDVLTILDEAFISFVPFEQRKVCKELDDFEELIRVESFTKFYSCPGIRVGYVRTKKYADIFEKYRSPWGIGGQGFLFLEMLLKNRESLEKFEVNVIDYVAKERKKFSNFAYFPSLVNYFVTRIGDKFDVTDFLDFLDLRKIHVRSMDDFEMPGFIRVGLKDVNSNIKLLEAMTDFFEKRICCKGGN